MMRSTAMMAAATFAMVIMLPAAAGQASTVTACDPASCDPLTANGGEVKTGDEPVRVILYAHMQDILQEGPLNTQRPGPQESDVVFGGSLMPTLKTAAPVAPGFENNRVTWFLSPGPVEYKSDRQWSVRQEPGLGTPLEIASDEMTLYFYTSPGHAAAGGEAPPVAPAVGVYARLLQGRSLSDDPGLLVAEGDTGSGYGEPEAGRVTGTTTMVSVPGEDTVYEFRVPMTIQRSQLPSVYDAPDEARGVIAEVVLYQLNSEAAQFTDPAWQVRGGEELAPRVVFDALRPLRTESARIVTESSDGPVLHFSWNVASTFGRYDVAPGSVELRVDGPAPFAPWLVRADHVLHHDGHYKPVETSWQHNLTDVPLEDGTYHVTASAMNQQGTYRVVWNESFEVQDGQPLVPSADGTVFEGSTPGFGGPAALAAVLVALVVVGMLGRRRVAPAT